MIKQFCFKLFSLARVRSLNVERLIFQTIQFSTSTHFFYLTIHRTKSGVTTLSQSGPGSGGNKGVLSISQNSNITGASTSDHLVSYAGQSFGGSYLLAGRYLVYFTAPADYAGAVKYRVLEM